MKRDRLKSDFQRREVCDSAVSTYCILFTHIKRLSGYCFRLVFRLSVQRYAYGLLETPFRSVSAPSDN